MRDNPYWTYLGIGVRLWTTRKLRRWGMYRANLGEKLVIDAWFFTFYL